MARPGHTVFTAMPSRTAQYPRAPRPLTPEKSGNRRSQFKWMGTAFIGTLRLVAANPRQLKVHVPIFHIEPSCGELQ